MQMEADPTYIRQLFFEKLSGLLSLDEERKLADLLANSTKAREIWKQLELENEVLAIEKVLDHTNLDAALANTKLGRPFWYKTPILGLKSWAVAATVALVLGTAYIFLGNNKKQNQTPILAQAANIRLILSDGDTLGIDPEQTQKFSIGNLGIFSKGGALSFKGSLTDESDANLNTLIVPVKETYELLLSDGTKVSLNSDSKLRFPFNFNKSQREVYLEGEAFFEVAKNKEQPFVVHTASNDITVTGTRFNVHAYGHGKVKTSLIEGGVDITDTNQEKVVLKPGMSAEYQKDLGFQTKPFNNTDVTSWREGVYYFNNQPLLGLQDVIARWYGLDLQFESNAIAHFKVTGLLEKGQIEDFLKDLNTTSGLQYSIRNNELIIF